MSPRTARWFSKAATAMAAAFLVLVVFSIADSRLETLRSRHAIELSQLDFSSIAREDLPRPVEPFRSDVQLINDNPALDDNTRLSAPETSKSEASTSLDRLKRVEDQKKKAEDKLRASRERVKLLEVQRRELDHYFQQRSRWTSLTMLGCLLGYTVFSRSNKQRKLVVGSEV
jgi:hypothetical protein